MLLNLASGKLGDESGVHCPNYCVDPGSIVPRARPDSGSEFLLYPGQFLKEEDSGELMLWVPRIIPKTYPAPAPSQAQTCVKTQEESHLCKDTGDLPSLSPPNLLPISAQGPPPTQPPEPKAPAFSHSTQLTKPC